MKTKVLATVLISMMVFASVNVFGGKPQRRMTFYIAGGMVKIPVKVEEAPDSLPEAVVVKMLKMEADARCQALTLQFDLSLISKPEKDADDVTIDTRKIFDELRYREFARR
ncbi:MAG: hypothetical protein RBS53_11150 [Bacteroidales bacterium]|nr:hypothetical protein [Bacteroidales bacterium]NLM92331.1 hypothetical protein [Bacteroidales bacterium]